MHKKERKKERKIPRIPWLKHEHFLLSFFIKNNFFFFINEEKKQNGDGGTKTILD
jgi:hypothetical protein